MTEEGSSSQQRAAVRMSPRKRGLSILSDEEDKGRALSELRCHVAEILRKQQGIKKPKDVMAFFVDIKTKEVGGQQLVASCMFCHRNIHSTGATRLVEHLTSCPLCLKEVKEPVMMLKDKTAAKRKEKAEESKTMVQEAEIQHALIKAQKTELKQQGLRAGFQLVEGAIADQAIADFFYANALPFGTADTTPDSYYMRMIRAIQQAGPTYVPPNKNKLAGSLLDDAHERMLKSINARDADGVLADKFGVAYTQDGWDSCDNLPLINSAYITANDGGVYHRSVDTSGHTKDAAYIASLMISDIYSIGCTKVVLVVTDTCNTMKAAWEFVEDEFPWISAVPCVPHVVSLMMKDVGKIPQVTSLLKEESTIVNWFSHHQKPLAILRAKVTTLLGKRKELVKAGATRFGTHTLVGERLIELKPALQQTVVDPEYIKQGFKDLPDEQEVSNSSVLTRENKGGTAKQLTLDDSGFWTRVEEHVTATTPMVKLLRRHDSSAPTVGKVYQGFFALGEHLKQSSASYKAKLAEAHASRWQYGHVPFFAAAYALDPEFQSHDHSSNAEISEGLLVTMEKMAILFEVRRLQALDGRFSEDWKNRAEMISTDKSKQQTYINYPKYPDINNAKVKEFCAQFNAQLALYRGKKGGYGRE